jgi:hypothetical protein
VPAGSGLGAVVFDLQGTVVDFFRPIVRAGDFRELAAALDG